MGSGWYRHALALCLLVVALSAAILALAVGEAAVLYIGIAVLGAGVLVLAGFFSPWFDQDWPLDGKDGWLASGAILTTVGAAATAAGLLLGL